jgi:hypothetical protein
MKAAALLLAVLFLPQAKDKTQETPPLPKEPIRDWKYTRKDVRHDVKTGKDVEEITAILAGEEAVPVNFDKKIFDLRGVTARYFTEPARGKHSKEIVVVSERGRYDHEARTLRFDDRVRVVKKNDDVKPPLPDTVLHAQHALLRFNKMYECATCRRLLLPPDPLKLPGKCATHGEPLKEVNVTSIEVEGPFDLAGPEGILSGEGLVTDDAINREYHITRNGFIEFTGEAAALQGDRKVPEASVVSEARFSQIFSRGPLHVTGPEHERTIQGQDGMRIDRIDSSGSLTVRAREMTIVALRTIDPETQKLSAPDIRNVNARGKVEMEGSIFDDGSLFHTKSETFTRTLEPNPDPKKKDIEIEKIVLRSSEIPVFIESGANEIQARTVTITREKGTSGGVSVFEEVLDSKLRVGDQKFALKCDRLTTHAEPTTTGRTDLRKLDAEGRVVLGGLMSDPGAADKGDAGEARADFFTWDVLARRGLLEAKPFVRITQGPSTIVAPKVVLESPNIIVLKGPKQVHLLQERDGVKEEYRATCDGDLVMDQQSRRLWMRDRCLIRTKEMTLKSDRVNALMTEDGKGLESLLALGKVHAVRRSDPKPDQRSDETNIYGERLAFRFKDQDLRVYGSPYAVVEAGNTMARQGEIRVFEKRHPKTGQMIRYTEMIGDRDGVHIEILEKARK